MLVLLVPALVELLLKISWSLSKMDGEGPLVPPLRVLPPARGLPKDASEKPSLSSSAPKGLEDPFADADEAATSEGHTHVKAGHFAYGHMIAELPLAMARAQHDADR